MALVLLAAASYAAYQANLQRQDSTSEPDFELDLEGKVPIWLLPLERELTFFEIPIVTVSFFSGNYQAAARHLEQRVEEILVLNPWLAGWLRKDPADHNELKIFYDPEGKDRCPGYVEIYEPSAINLSQSSTAYQDMAQMMLSSGAMISSNRGLVDKNRPFFKVSLIPDAQQPNEKYSLVVSLSRVAGDIPTYYFLLRMMDINSKAWKLDPVRRTSYEEAVDKAMGTKEALYVKSALSQPPTFPSSKDRSEDDPVGFRVFQMSNHWLVQHQTAADGAFDKFDKDDMESTRALLSSWFFSLNAASIGLVVLDMRNRLEGIPVNKESAGGYSKTLPLRLEDYLSPDLVQQGIKKLHRCGSGSQKHLPSFLWTMTSAAYASWEDFFDSLQLENDQPMQSHLPLHDLPSISSLPDRLSMWITFRLKGEGDGKLGAFVICRQSVWSQIQASGVVESVIADIKE